MNIKNNLIEEHDKIVVAVSGGPDSMCLLDYLNKLKKKYKLEIYASHINHHTRGQENLDELALIEQYCLDQEIPLFTENFHYSGESNFHDEARKFRYDFFLNVCKQVNAHKIALAHHLDDQVETILFKMTRGSHITGYTGMKDHYYLNEKIQIIRPFIHLTKKEILEICEEHKIPFKIDSSNLEDHYTRNLLRHKIIPQFKIIQPDFNDKIKQFQEQLGEVNDFLLEFAKNIFKDTVCIHNNNEIVLDLEKLKHTHISVIRLILLNVFKKLTNNKVELSYDKANNIISNINNPKPNITFDVGKGYFCVKEYNRLIFRKGLLDFTNYEINLNGFGEYTLPNSMKINVKSIQERVKIHSNSMILCYNSTMWPLVIRNRKDGDFIHTKIGKKKLKRIFIDSKIPASQRETWPILTDCEGNLLWVIGLQRANIEIDDNKQYVLISVE